MQGPKAIQKLLNAIDSSLPSKQHLLTRVVARACLLQGFQASGSIYQLAAVCCSQIGAVVKQQCPDMPGKLITNLQNESCSRYFMMIPGPPGKQPAVLLRLPALISKPYSAQVQQIMSRLYSSSEHPSTKQSSAIAIAAANSSGPASAMTDELGVRAPAYLASRSLSHELTDACMHMQHNSLADFGLLWPVEYISLMMACQ